MRANQCTFVAETTLSEACAFAPEELRKRVCYHKVLVIRAREFDLERFCSLLHSMGLPITHVLDQFCLTHHRDVMLISNLYVNGKPVGVHEGGAYWHTDMAYRANNAVLTALSAEKVPLSGGETEFVDCEAGLKLLRRDMFHRGLAIGDVRLDLGRAFVLHRFGNREQRRTRDAYFQTLSEEQAVKLTSAIHPLITRHPITAGESLYGVAGTASQIVGLDDSGSEKVLNSITDYVLVHAPRYKHTYRVGDIVIWDNLSTLHRGPTIERTDDSANCRLLYRMNVELPVDQAV